MVNDASKITLGPNGRNVAL